MNRWIKKNSKGIALLDEDGHGLRYVFDISDTRSPTNRPLHLWNIQEEDYPEFIEMIDNKYGPFQYPSNDLGEIILKMTEVITQDNCQDYLSSLVKYNRDSNLEYLEEHEIQSLFENLVSKSIAFEIINRCGLDTSLYFDEHDFYDVSNFNSLDTIGQLGTTCHDLCEMGMQDISAKAREIMIRTFANQTKVIENENNKDERSYLYENNHIQSSGRLSNAQPYAILNSHYARLRYQYLKNNHPGHLFALKAKNQLNQHLMEIETQAQEKMETMMKQLLVKHPAPNKETNQMEWVAHMNNLKSIANEVILKEIIYN